MLISPSAPGECRRTMDRFWICLRQWLKSHHQPRGNVSVVFALSFVAVVGAVGAALDFNSALSARHNLQDALDSAVLAGVTASSASQQSVASQTFTQNLSSSISLSSQSYSASSASSSSAGTVTTSNQLAGSATGHAQTYMLQLFGISQVNVSVKATAIASKQQSGATPCIYVLDPSGSQALLVNSGASVTAPGCEIDVASTGNPAAIFNSGSSLNFRKLCLKGTQTIQNSTTVANLSTGCATQPDPYAGKLPTPSSSTCTYANGNYNDATVAMSPGTYCGWFNFNNSSAKVTFAPGVYVIKGGGWNVNGGAWTGSGVTFYFADTSKIQFNSGISAMLSAPGSGTYANLLFYEAPGLSNSDFIFNDSVANSLTGVIWLPSRNVTFNAKSGVNSDALTMVVYRMILNTTTWTLNPLSGSSSASSGSGATTIRLIK